MQIVFGKDRYHLIGEMEQWCRTHVGQGRWVGARLKTWKGMGDNVWAVESTFGHTSFMFKNETDATLFALRWL